MFSVSFGSERREAKIRKIGEKDPTTAVIIAAVPFEWMLKRTILKLGQSPTSALREQLEQVYSISDRGNREGYLSIWRREVQPRFRQAALGTVLGKLTSIKDNAMAVRGRVVHGNGTVSDGKAHEAIELFLTSGEKLREFTLKNGDDLDSRLKTRIKERSD
ncbi:hypothetical protein KT71_13964 [Congregibacter litoralis KT71]|uniref:RiboL-PSP-HEPN domain-containing protein n=2 Tax=Congregibacter TaxID=393661 RepID=A4AEB2_9GAMM|nr:hypothetical protein KT71_13964 [Congregibacter litoralis KT71]